MKCIGRYIIRGLLGKGGMGKIYKVELPAIGKIAALKLFDPDPLVLKLMGREHLHTLFNNEAKAMAGLRHPNIVDLHDFDQHRGQSFYVMEFLPNNLGAMIGESYRTEQPSRIIRVDKTLHYLHQTLSGITCLHHAGIIHRDIKPYNLLVSSQDQIKICDFGLSKLRGEVYTGPANLNVGSPYYAPPEQERNPDGVDRTADLYPVGIMLYRMLTGRLPASDTPEAVYQPVSRFNSDLDEAWDEFIRKAIHRRPQQRFADAEAMLLALEVLGAHWNAQKDRACAFAPEETPQPAILHKRIVLRSKPIKIKPSHIAAQQKVDALWRPAAYVQNNFARQQDYTIPDHATGLIWQQSGTPCTCSWHQAHGIIARLRKERFAGLQQWRLPTIEELMSLLRPVAQTQDLCIAPLFSPVQRWLWSADRRSFTAAYYVDVELGFVGWQDFSAPYFVRAVCNA